MMSYGKRDFPDGRTVEVIPLTYGRARIVIGPTDGMTYSDGW